MRSTMAVVLSAILCFPGCAARAEHALSHDKSPLDNWTAVPRPRAQSVLAVDLASGILVYGRLVSTTQIQLTILEGTTERTLSRPEIHRIRTTRDRSARTALRGLVLGAAAGGFAGGVVAGSALLAGMLATWWGLSGFADPVGLGLRDKGKEVVVYVSTSQTAPAMGRHR